MEGSDLLWFFLNNVKINIAFFIYLPYNLLNTITVLLISNPTGGNAYFALYDIMATIKEISENLGLSQATVSRALRRDKTLSISHETKARIFAEAQKLGYTQKIRKEHNKKQKKNILVLHKQQTFRNQIDSSYYFSVRSGIEEYCESHSITCEFTTVETALYSAFDYDGVIAIGNYEEQLFEKVYHKFANLPLVSIGQLSCHPEKVIQVTYSNYDTVNMALEYLLENGHTKIGYFGIREAYGIPSCNSRKEIFRQILSMHGFFHPEWVYESEHGKNRVDEGYKMMKSCITQNAPLPTAVFCANDPVALGVMKAACEEGLDIPGDLSIISHDGSYPAKYTVPPLTTIDVHPFDLGYEAVDAINQFFTKTKVLPKKIVFYPELRVRGSVKAL